MGATQPPRRMHGLLNLPRRFVTAVRFDCSPGRAPNHFSENRADVLLTDLPYLGPLRFAFEYEDGECVRFSLRVKQVDAPAICLAGLRLAVTTAHCGSWISFLPVPTGEWSVVQCKSRCRRGLMRCLDCVRPGDRCNAANTLLAPGSP